MTLSHRLRLPVLVVVCLSAGLAALLAQGRGGGAAVVPTQNPPQSGQTSATPVPATGTAAISGVVVDGATGQPVSAAVVSMIVGARMTIAGPTALITDDRGRFVFPRLPAGGYALSASKPGYSTGRYGQSDPVDSTIARTIRLADGQWFADAKVPVWRPGAITGRVIDEAGEPVVGAFVRVIAEVLVAGKPRLANATAVKTDDRGVYRVSGLIAGKYVVMVPSVQATIPGDSTPMSLAGLTPQQVDAVRQGLMAVRTPDTPFSATDGGGLLALGIYPTPPSTTTAYPVTFFPAARTIANASPIDLHAGEERSGVDVRISPARTVRVSGVLQGPPDAGVGGMLVRLLPVGNESLGFGAEMATARAAGDGAFTLVNVPAGNYTLIVSQSMMSFAITDGTPYMGSIPQPPGFSLGGGGGTGLIAGNLRYSYSNGRGRAYAAQVPLSVGDQNLNSVVVPLVRTATMTGRVVFAASASPSAGPTPVRASIRLEPANGDPSLGMPSGSATSPDLTFRIESLMPGPYVLRSTGLGGPAGTVKSVEWEGRDYTDRPFDASAGRDIENVVITFTNEVATIAGTVRAGTAPASSGVVIIFPADPARWSGYGFTPPRINSIQVGTNGTFNVPRYLAGEYYLVAVDDAQANGWRDPKFLEAAAPLATKVSVAWGETKSVDLAIVAVKVGR